VAELVQLTRLVRTSLSPEDSAALQTTDVLAEALRVGLDARRTDIDLAHVHGAGSAAIQYIVGSILRELAFREEVVLTPEDGFVIHARTDFYHRISAGRGVIAEVERGGTVTNNHDLKDLWKTHLSPDAQHLFLVVPVSNWRSGGTAREKPYARVSRRLGAFFGHPRREIDVISCHIFGYGATSLGIVAEGIA
jgi:hypothetical protein